METIRRGKGRIARIRHGLLHFARVSLEVRFPAEETTLVLACQGRGFFSQGSLEEVPASGYDDWKQGALAGIAYALAASGTSPCQITVTTIEGFSTDTNPTIVGGAAILAVWSAVAYQPARKQLEHIDQLVFQSWSYPADHLPQF
jgi:hypothetical protein